VRLRLRTVQNLLRRFRLRPDALAPDYRTRPCPPHPALAAVLRCRGDHPGWGAELIRAQLLGQQQDLHLPAGRTLQRGLRRAGLGPAQPGRKVASRPRADAPHAVWQTDAAEHLVLADAGRSVG
jgi:hypothetical protein